MSVESLQNDAEVRIEEMRKTIAELETDVKAWKISTLIKDRAFDSLIPADNEAQIIALHSKLQKVESTLVITARVAETAKEKWTALQEELEDVREAREDLEVEIEALTKGRVLTCVYCGHKYPQGTPDGDEVLTNHIKDCPRHPLRAARKLVQHMLGCKDGIGICWHCDNVAIFVETGNIRKPETPGSAIPS